MRRNNREINGKKDLKSVIYISTGVLIVSIIAFVVTFIAYTNKLNNNSIKISTEKISELVPNETEYTEASFKMGKTVEEVENTLKENTIETNTTNVMEKKEKEQETKKQAKSTNTIKKEEKKEEVKNPEFIKPVEGEIIKKFANENLVYSETLKEWTIHNGIDIAAEKTTVVKAAEEGTVIAIKNDPRYGTTVIIEHTNGFETRYSNLLTTEFVIVGEKVERGQAVGTIGNSAMFEVVDASHLHFEILKDSEPVDPEQYMS